MPRKHNERHLRSVARLMDLSDYELIEAHLLDMREGPERWSENTARVRRYHLRDLADALSRAAWERDSDDPHTPWSSDAATSSRMAVATTEDLRAWAQVIRRRRDGSPRSAGGERNLITAAATFYRWLMLDRDARDDDPTVRLKRPHEGKRSPRPAREADVNFALRAASADPKLFCWLVLLACCGVRCCELAWMEVDDVEIAEDGQTAWWYCLGKGGKRRWIPISSVVLPYLRPFLKGRGRVFLGSRSHRPYSNQRVSAHIGEFFQRIGLEKCTPHQWRHFWATQFRSIHPDLQLQAELMGHESVDTTRLYTQILPEEAVEPMDELAAARMSRIRSAGPGPSTPPTRGNPLGGPGGPPDPTPARVDGRSLASGQGRGGASWQVGGVGRGGSGARTPTAATAG